jgi:Fe-S oxidoreductase
MAVTVVHEDMHQRAGEQQQVGPVAGDVPPVLAQQEEGGDERVNINRAQEAIDTGASTVISECPFCAVMLGDGVAALVSETNVKDLAVVLSEALER